MHEIRVDDKFVLGTAKIRWPAVKGQTLPLLAEPAVLTHLSIARSLRLVQSGNAQELMADASGTFDIEVQYQLQIVKGTSGKMMK